MPATLQPHDIAHVIALAWADEISFDLIRRETGLCEPEVKALMRSNLKPGSYRVWRKRVTGRKMKHQYRLRPSGTPRPLPGYDELAEG